MTWMELYILLKNQAEIKHPCLVNTPATRVTILIDNEEWYVDIVESLTSGKLVLVPDVISTSPDGE